MLRRVDHLPSLLSTSTSLRCASTGDHHTYQPGKLTLAIRATFQALTPTSLRKRLALRMQSGMEQVEALEQEQQWLRRHGSPLSVMGLPEHAEMMEVRARYRDLILETHPDSSSSSNHNALTSSGTSEGQDNSREAYHTLRTAYLMVMNPNSLFHQNRSAPQLYQELVAGQPFLKRLESKVSLFAMASYGVMLFIGIVVANYFFREFFERSLEWADPDFYKFMVAQEKEEERKREAGEFVDTDPKRYAPKKIRKLAYPGRFVHGTEVTPEMEWLAAKELEQQQRGQQ